jgi:hypothetical protein
MRNWDDLESPQKAPAYIEESCASKGSGIGRFFNGLDGPIAAGAAPEAPTDCGYPGSGITRCTILRYPDIGRG